MSCSRSGAHFVGPTWVVFLFRARLVRLRLGRGIGPARSGVPPEDMQPAQPLQAASHSRAVLSCGPGLKRGSHSRSVVFPPPRAALCSSAATPWALTAGTPQRGRGTIPLPRGVGDPLLAHMGEDPKGFKSGERPRPPQHPPQSRSPRPVA
ncbi:hypothetical protein NDU88_001946 [Pleurodeles waltl]|uniref:Uncharacterized protein n=1 Tax=Pleurodeles waltl TaxID=8319 RepID=A0AAV7M9L9_PLEWA|nr:hypothetical protein NDU88_001946 [Pleurodeles waltl]